MAVLRPLADWRDFLGGQEAATAGVGGGRGHWGGGLLGLDKLFPSHYSDRICLKHFVKVEYGPNEDMSTQRLILVFFLKMTLTSAVYWFLG